MNKTTIEDLLSWAFTEELCKVGARAEIGVGFSAAWSGIAEVATLGTLIDYKPNHYGVVPSFIFEGTPHPSAVLVGDVVRQLVERGGFDIGAGWNPFPEWSDPQALIADEVRRALVELGVRDGVINGRQVVNLVINCAIMKRGPDWRAKEPRAMVVTGDRGKPLWFVMRSAKDRTGKTYVFEDNGYDPVKRRPVKGAFRKWRLEYPVRGAILSRLDWQLWQSALEVLHVSLSQLPQFAHMVEFRPNRHPWIGDENRVKISST